MAALLLVVLTYVGSGESENASNLPARLNTKRCYVCPYVSAVVPFVPSFLYRPAVTAGDSMRPSRYAVIMSLAQPIYSTSFLCVSVVMF